MKQVLNGEKVARTTKVQDEIVIKNHVTYNKPTDSHYQLEWQFDFANVTKAELMELASNDLVIAMRPKFKTAPGTEIASWDNQVFNVRDYLDHTRTVEKLTDYQKAERALLKLTPEQRKQLKV